MPDPALSVMAEKHKLTRRQRRTLFRILSALAAFLALAVTDRVLGLSEGAVGGWGLPFLLYLAIYLWIGYDVLLRAGRNLLGGSPLDENFLMCVATFGAFALAIWRGTRGERAEGFDEACAVLLFYQVGEFFQNYATGKARRSVSALMEIRPDFAHVVRNGVMETVLPEEVEVGECITVLPGERIPLDGLLVKGETALDARALTGESAPEEVAQGHRVLSGCVNLSSQIEICVEKAFYDSTVSRILEMVEHASDKKSRAEQFISRFATVYTPTVVGLALALAILPSLITGAWSVWIYRALSFLVVSCPCALVISVPMTFFVGIGAASSRRILIKGSNYLEQLSRARLYVFDKTGTLTKGSFSVRSVHPEARREEVLRLAAIAEQNSSHPIARSICEAWGGVEKNDYVLTNLAGFGVRAEREGDVILCGNAGLMQKQGIALPPQAKRLGTVVYVAQNGAYVGEICVADEEKSESREVIGALRRGGARAVMLTGDREEVAREVAAGLGISEYRASLLPQDKVSEVEALLREKQARDVLCFVGDGINDAPVLMRSDVGIAMGGIGSDAAIEAADVVLMRDDLRDLLTAQRIARRTMRIVRQNVIFSLAIKGAILLLSAFGFANMWMAIFGDVGVAVLAILNAMRGGRLKETHNAQAGRK